MLAHPKRLDRNLNLRSFIFFSTGFFRRTAERRRAAGNGDHLELDVGARNRRGVGDHVALLRLDEPSLRRSFRHQPRALRRARRSSNRWQTEPISRAGTVVLTT